MSSQRITIAFTFLSLLFFNASCSQTAGDVAEAPHQYQVDVSGLV